MGIKKLKKSVKRIERMLDQQSRLIDKALSGGEAPQGDTFVVESTLAENSGGNGFTISEDRQTINYLGENYYTERAWADRGDEVDDKAWASAKLAELDAACLQAKSDLEQAGSTVLLARPLEPCSYVSKLKVTVKDWVRYDQDKSCLWESCSESHTDQYGCIGVKKFGKRVVLAEINTDWVDRLVNNYLAKKEACDKAAIALNEFSHRNMGKAKDEGVPLTDEQAAQLDSGSGTEDAAVWTCEPCDAEAEQTTGWLAGDIADAVADSTMRKHRKRMEKAKGQRKIKDEPQA